MSSNRYVSKNTFNTNKFLAQNILNEYAQNISLPNNSETNQVQPNQFVNGTINLFFKKLLDNDKIISCYIDQLDNKINKTEASISANFKQEDQNYNTDNIAIKYNLLSTEHINTYHNKNSSIEILNTNAALNDCSDLKLELTEQKLTKIEETDNQFCATDDEVIEFEFDDDDLEQTHIIVNVYNKATSYQKAFYIMDERIQGNIPSLIKVPYIIKKWISGIKELYVYLGTTFTFYNSVPDTDNPTLIDLSLSKKHFNINEIIDLKITGQSFPIKIDISTTNRLYTDKILPSVVTDVKTSNDEEYYHLYFACYGTDSQAISIKFK